MHNCFSSLFERFVDILSNARSTVRCLVATLLLWLIANTAFGFERIQVLPELKIDDPNSFSVAVNQAEVKIRSAGKDIYGKLYSTWNPSGPDRISTHEVSILFFGHGDGCAPDAKDGDVAISTGSMATAQIHELGYKIGLVGQTWMPSGEQKTCTAQSRVRFGDSEVALVGGGVDVLALRTGSFGEDTHGNSFFRPFSVAGSNGKGTNPNILNTTVSFRNIVSEAKPLRPWAASGILRLHSEQEVRSVTLPASLAGSKFAQVKQQVMVTFVDSQCSLLRPGPAHLCQIQFVFHTAIAQSNIDVFPATARIWFDQAQASMLIVSGSLPASDDSVMAADTNLSVYTSVGSSTEHKPFTMREFDVSIGFDQLMNALKIGTAKRLKISVSEVSMEIMAREWGDRWNEKTSWNFVSINAVQEIFNNTEGRTAQITGSFHSLFVGPF